jgi:5-(carboxyamino)imidazole ribonucleotide synthase
MFQTRDNRLLINELAMRHNSGHFSIEGSTTSQFEQHLRAVFGPSARRHQDDGTDRRDGEPSRVDSQNTFVEHYERAMAAHPNVEIHTYGKSARAGENGPCHRVG